MITLRRRRSAPKVGEPASSRSRRGIPWRPLRSSMWDYSHRTTGGSAIISLCAGLRFENQTNIDDWLHWAPRAGIAWAIPSGRTGSPLAVVRFGYGAFYDRIREGLVMDAGAWTGCTSRSM